MSIHKPIVSQQLLHFNRSPSKLHDQLTNVLYSEEYKQWAQNLQGDDLVWFVDYLDKVHHHIPLPCFLLNPV